MSVADLFPEITKRDEPLAPYTHLKIGGGPSSCSSRGRSTSCAPC